MLKTVYSLDSYIFTYEELSDLSHLNLSIGDKIYSGTPIKPKPLDLINHTAVIDYIEHSAWDIADEFSENSISNISDEAKKELDELLSQWITKNINIDFFTIYDIKPLIIDEEIYNKIMEYEHVKNA